MASHQLRRREAGGPHRRAQGRANAGGPRGEFLGAERGLETVVPPKGRGDCGVHLEQPPYFSEKPEAQRREAA